MNSAPVVEAVPPLASAAAVAAAVPLGGGYSATGETAAFAQRPAGAALPPVDIPAGVTVGINARSVVTGSAVASGASPHLAKKIQRALNLRVDSQTSRDGLKCLSGFFGDNSAQARRNLRTTIEGQNLLLHKEFVTSFSNLESRIEALDKLVVSLDVACDRAASQLRQSKSETQAVLEKASALQNEAQTIEDKRAVLKPFLAKFRVSEADTQLVRSGDTPMGEEFFCAFERLEEVRRNARQLLNTSGQQTSGVDILHETSEILEASYERMFVWVQQQCRKPKSSAVARASGGELDGRECEVLRRVLTLLAERPVYFNHCFRDISKARRQALVVRFFEALSQGDASGARPIELQVCDPVRYVGDMLAWTHENAAAERDALASLMGRATDLAAGGTDAATAPKFPSHGEASLTLVPFDEILDFCLEGLADSFDARLKQVLQNQTSIVVVYKVAQVFSFFAKTLEEALKRPDAKLVAMCRDLRSSTYQTFLELWERQAQRLRQGVAGVYVSDLSTPPFVAEAVGTLSEVLGIYGMAPVPAEEREADFLPVLSAAFDPLLNHCQHVAAMMDTSDGQVFMVNCISAMQAPLKNHPFTMQRVGMYDSLLGEHLGRLVDGLSAAVSAKVGLAERLQALRAKPADAPLGSVPELHPVSLEGALRCFYNSLFTLDGALSLPALERISDRGLRAEARSGIAKLLAAAYEELYEGVKELGVATYTPDQVCTLLE